MRNGADTVHLGVFGLGQFRVSRFEFRVPSKPRKVRNAFAQGFGGTGTVLCRGGAEHRFLGSDEQEATWPSCPRFVKRRSQNSNVNEHPEDNAPGRSISSV